MIITSMAQPLMLETVWFDKYRFDEAEKKFEEEAAQQRKGGCVHEQPVVEMPKSSLAEEIANARQHILNTLQSGDIHLKSTTGHKDYEALANKCEKLENDNKVLHKILEQVQSQVQKLSDRLLALEKTCAAAPKESKVVKEEKNINSVVNNNHTGGGDDDDDDIDLFGSEEEDDEAANKLREERLKAYENKKSKKAPLVAKSSVVLDIKPWDDETDMKEMEVRVRQIESEGLKWGASKLVPLAYGIKKLQIVSVVEDDKVSIDWLQETIQDSIDDLVQSVDIAAFNKL